MRSSNISPNKTDTFVQRTLHYEATGSTRPPDRLDAVLTVTLANSAPLDCPSYVLSNRDISRCPRRPGVWVQLHDADVVLTPAAAGRAGGGGHALAVDSQLDAGVHSYAAIATVDAGQSVDITFHLHGQLDPGHGYQLTLVHQPTANDDQVTVVVHGAGSGGEEPAFPLTEDTTLRFGHGPRSGATARARKLAERRRSRMVEASAG